MLAARLGGKIPYADLEASVRALRSHVLELALPDKPREVPLAVPRDPGGLGEVHDPIGFGDEGGFDLGRRPLERAGRALGAEGLTELLGLGADVGDCLVNGAALRTQKDTPPEESCSSGGVLRVGDYARSGPKKSRGGAGCGDDPVTEALGALGAHCARLRGHHLLGEP